MKLHCLFEQSGTFKNQAKLLGLESEDYDILNDYGQTDHQIDLFKEIDLAYRGGQSMFDNINKDDYVIAFFPCIRFENQILLWFRGENYAQRNWTMLEKLKKDIALHEELNYNYKILTELVIVALMRGFKLIIENPYSSQHYLQKYWCIKPSFIDEDRTECGDFYKKPTQYWFINCKPHFNVIFDAQTICKKKIIEKERGASRSMMSPEYANHFIKEMIL